MAKPSKKRSRNKPISVSEIYETIQAPDFRRELWFDLISDIQEKPTYKHLKGMVDDVINDTTRTFTSKSVDGNEEQKWRTALTEISIMTYTLDTVISEVLYRRYQNEFENIVKNLIKDLLEKKTKEASNPAEDGSMFENIEKIFDKENIRLIGKKENDCVVSDAKKSAKDLAENDSPARKRGRPKKVNVDKEKAKNMNTVPKRKRGRPPLTAEKTMTENFDDKEKIKSEKKDQESDAESDTSIGNLSIDSVSSVHTSELSSFEDTVSICSGDEGEKKHIPLKVANDMYLQGKLSQIYYFGKRSERFKLMQNASTSNSMDLITTNNSSSANVDSLSHKVLPKRIRKPNSKYNSETMYCGVKDYSSPPPDTGSSSSQEETENKSSGSPKVQRKRKRSNLNKGTPSSPSSKNSAINNASSPRNSSASKRVKTRNSPLSKASTKRYDTSDLYKPRSVTGSTIGSRSTAVTLFSS